MNTGHSHLDIALGAIPVFTDDGRMDATELQRLLDLALRDARVDEDEKRVLDNVFRRAEQAGVTPDVAERIAQARRQHGIE
ncbi:hypothetical protein H0E84_07930 [Luteimonas sp. SJ-92]|uniref:Co-chaperone DjlA N-terminal domain-containing protein n=1 Tax=Luteimonas salinisoli TaxID=2752307 RepID=A0A853JC16_9GAMM|nr:hypothetical protein [Luteimonas salinisoli]NZA26312.1 hypothetical protein [Luteimonas salinisoli]